MAGNSHVSSGAACFPLRLRADALGLRGGALGLRGDGLGPRGDALGLRRQLFVELLLRFA